MVKRDILGRYRGQLRRRVLDHHQSAAADADLLLRVRSGAARPLRSERQLEQLRALFPSGHAAVAGLQRGGRTRRPT